MITQKNGKKIYRLLLVGVISLGLFCSCQSRSLKEAGLGEEKIVRDAKGNYYRLIPHVGDTFFVRPLNMEEFQEF